ncbi:MAG: hypothetical protein KF861_16750, partial [Planctomycetaceae bacterium]|nr:hypothetical protein [Planctomycetaceae bacterium]
LAARAQNNSPASPTNPISSSGTTAVTTPPATGTPTPTAETSPVPAIATAPVDQPAEGAAPVAVQPIPPESLLRDWTKADGQPLLTARFIAVTPAGDVRVALMPRQWTLAGTSTSADYPAFSGTFWAFYQKPGTPILVRIGEVKLPDVPLNYVDYPRDAFSTDDRAYLDHLEQLIDYAYVNKGRIRYYTLPWDAISIEDQQFVHSVVNYVQSLQPPSQSTAGNGPPEAAEVPQEDPAGPPDLPATDVAPAPDADVEPPQTPYGY